MTSKKLVLKFIAYLKPYLIKEILILGLLIIGNLGALATPYALKIIIDDVFPEGNYSDLVFVLSALVCIYIIRILANILTDVFYTKISRSIVSDIREDMVDNMLNRPISYFKTANSGDIMLNLTSDIENIQVALSSLMLNFLNNSLTIIGIIIMLAYLDLNLTLISILLFPIILYSIKKFTPHLQKSFKNIQEKHGSLNNFILEKIRNIRVVKSYGSTQFELSKLNKIQTEIIKLYTKNAILNSSNKNITTLFVAIGPVIVLAYGGDAVFSGALTLGSLIAFIQYLNKLFSPTINIMNSYAQFNNAIVSMRRVNSFLVSESQNKKPSKELNDKIRSIDFNNVSLKINESIILEKINISLFPGNVYGIYGKSGSGKSSLFNLLCGFLNPTGGEILINKEYPINDIEDWNKKIGLVEKENQLFTDTILSNLKYGNFDKSIEDVFLSMEMASFEKVVKSLEKGWDTHINETGTMLSDGEKQRISIARAFLKKPELILLDEATSALDSELELSVIQNIKKHFKDSIIIIITHKLSSIERFDKVFNIDNKRIEPANNCSLKLI